MLCDTNTVCDYSVQNSHFNDSVATIKGGAIYYNLYRPLLDKNIFENNQAEYGNDIGSYPIRIKLKDADSDELVLDNIVSGQVYMPALQFQLTDHDDQVVSTDSYSKIRISSISNETQVEGVLTSIVNQGVSSFDNLILIAKPGSMNVSYGITSSAIDQNIIDLQYKGSVEQQLIDATFRYCESGEIETNDQ